MTKSDGKPLALCIIGGGRVGGAFALALAARGMRVTLVSRRPAALRGRGIFGRGIRVTREIPPAASIYLLAVPDGRIAAVAKSLAAQVKNSGAVFLHCSGARSVADLALLKKLGAVGALHPLCAIADARGGAMALPGSPLSFQGGTAGANGALKAATRIAKSLGSELFRLPAGCDRLVYHAAAVLASNLPFALWLEAEALLAPLLGGGARARRALAPLIAAAAANYGRRGRSGLTGPAVRGDKKLIAAETAALSGAARDDYARLSARLLRGRFSR